MKRLIKRPIVITGILVSIAISVFMILMRQDTVLSFGVGLLSAILTLLLEILNEQQASEARLLESLGLSPRALESPLIHEVVKKATHCLAQLETKFRDSLVSEHFQRATEEYLEQLDGLSLGRVRLSPSPSENWIMAARLVDRAHKSGKAVAYGELHEQWNRDYNRAYWEANHRALQRGVKITRIFMMPEKDIASLKEVLEEQEKSGIDVYVAIEERVPPNLKKDFAIWDDKYLGYSEVTATGEIAKGFISINELDVREAERWFENLLHYSRSFSPSSV